MRGCLITVPLYVAGDRDSRDSGPKTKASKRDSIRLALQSSSWYNSSLATSTRMLLHGRPFKLLMILAVATVLLLPDMWILCGVNSSLFLDVFLTFTLILLTAETMALSATDAAYFMSFLSLMDVVGTASVLLDISFVFGSDSTKTSLFENRAVGMRAFRLSRALRIVRFLPKDADHAGITTVMSAQLAHLVATRVASLTILLIVIIPFFGVFPQQNLPCQFWTDRLSADLEDKRLDDFQEDLNLMTGFFTNGYGPYDICGGKATRSAGQETFKCLTDAKTLSPSWTPPFVEAPQLASALHLHTDTLMISFNMHSCAQVEAAVSLASTMAVVFFMVVCSGAISGIVIKLAVHPLEGMLSIVRQIATTVFRFSEEVGADDGDSDEDSFSEMVQLERVVHKLAIIADLHTRNGIGHIEDMRDEDFGVLSMMRGKNVVEEAKADRSSLGPSTGRKKPKLSHLKLEDHIGMSQEVYMSWSVNCLGMPKVQHLSLALFTIARFHEGESFAASPEEATLKKFVQVLEREYLPNPYHNFSHAVDVLHGVARIMRLMSSEVLLSELEQYSLLIAAIGHDMGHPGVNNGFLSEVGHELALQYNDRSPLENMHCAKLYAVLAQPETDLFVAMSKVQLKEVRKIIIDAILHTDMMSHQAMVKDLQAMYQGNMEVFTENAESNAESNVHTESEIEVLSQPATKVLIMNVILHGADISNTCRSWQVTYAWAHACIDEFFDQGDREKEFGIPVQFLNDRDTLNRPNSQIGFIEFMITPFLAAEVRVLRGLGGMATNLLVNIRKWEELWVQEARPPEEERHKVRTRVEKVQECIDQAMRRASVPS